jgi:hypothetical protein
MGLKKEKINIIKWGHKIKAKGVYNLDDLYVELQLWFSHMGYSWHEVEYKKMVFGGGAYRAEIIWIGTKRADDYNSYEMKISLAADVKDAEVTLDGGKKVKRQKAGLEFITGAKLVRDTDIWKDWGPFPAKFQKNLYEHLIRDRLRHREDELWGEANKLYDELKAFLLLFPH